MKRLKIIHERLLDWGIWRRYGALYQHPTMTAVVYGERVTLNEVEATASKLNRISQTDKAVSQLNSKLLACVVGLYVLNLNTFQLTQEVGIGPAALHRRLCVADRQLLGYLDGENQ